MLNEDAESAQWSHEGSASSTTPNEEANDFDADLVEADSPSNVDMDSDSDTSSTDSNDIFERFERSVESPFDSESDPEPFVCLNLLVLFPCGGISLISFSYWGSESFSIWVHPRHGRSLL